MDIRISRRRSKLDLSGKQQDCLGMTPLHILACSTSQSIDLYKVLIDKYPETLVTEDRWGAIPLLYAIWGSAPDEIIQFLIDSYKSIYPDYELNWTSMLKTLGTVVALDIDTESNCLEDIIQNFLNLQEESFPKHDIAREEVLDDLVEKGIFQSPLIFFTKCSIKMRLNAIGLKQYRDVIMKKMDSILGIHRLDEYGRRREFLTEVQTMFTQYETKYQSLKEATSVLELVLWKNKALVRRCQVMTGGGRGKGRLTNPTSEASAESIVEPTLSLEMCCLTLYQCQGTK